MSDAWEIILEGRALLAGGGRLHTKGSHGIPQRLRSIFLKRIDAAIPVSLTTQAAIEAPSEETAIEHLVPMKRIAIVIIDPAAHDPRTGGSDAEIPSSTLSA
ncbi:hypothetical protein [Marivita sp.]|uniref:hypothetical protein n=1 Tax=Marivita sp. TaxID=2003365 RepID=UPI003B51FAC5